MRIPHRHREALKENGNIVGLTLAAALSMALVNPLPLLVGLVGEAAYLLFVPDTDWYAKRMAKKHDAEVEKRRQELKAQVIPLLSPELQERFARLEQVRFDIKSQSMAEGQSWFQEVQRKLDFLLEKFLHFASKELQFRTYLQSVLNEALKDRGRSVPRGEMLLDTWLIDDPGSRRKRKDAQRQGGRPQPAPGRPDNVPIRASDRWIQDSVAEVQAHYDGEMESIRQLNEQEADPNTKAVLVKRIDVLQRRREFMGKIGRILTNLNHQLSLVEDTFGLINDEIRARSPEQVLADIDDVVIQTNTMTELLEEVAPMEQLIARMGA